MVTVDQNYTGRLIADMFNNPLVTPWVIPSQMGGMIMSGKL
jgi:hypothetical protein